MSNLKTHTDLAHIRNMMEQSTRFMSLSGLSGVFIGVYALLGATCAYWYLHLENTIPYETVKSLEFIWFFILDAGVVFTASILTAYFLSKRKASHHNTGFWNTSAKLMMINLAIPLIVGGAFCAILYYYGLLGLIAPTTLIFYGLALIQAGHFTIKDIRFLGVLEIILGLIAAFNIGYGLYFWAAGFGVLHILYGILIYYKYEKKN